MERDEMTELCVKLDLMYKEFREFREESRIEREKIVEIDKKLVAIDQRLNAMEQWRRDFDEKALGKWNAFFGGLLGAIITGAIMILLHYI